MLCNVFSVQYSHPIFSMCRVRETTFVMCSLFLLCSCLFSTSDGLYTPLTTSLRMRILGISSSLPLHDFSNAICRPLLPSLSSLHMSPVLSFHFMPRPRTWKVPQRTDHFLNASGWNFSSLFSDSDSGKNNTLSRKDVSKRAVKAWARSTSPGRPRADDMWVFH